MTNPHVSADRRTFSASNAVDVAGEVLLEIKQADNLTYTELGEAIGKGPDQAERIAKGNSVMDMPTFLIACMRWRERFADRVLALAGGRWAKLGDVCSSDEMGALTLAQLLPAIIAAEDDGVTEAHEIRPHEALIRKVHRVTGYWLDLLASNGGGER